MSRRLRVAHLILQPVLVWDDDESGELTPGPAAQPVQVGLADLPNFPARLRADLAAAEAEAA